MDGPSEAHDGWAVCDNAILTPPQYRGIAGDATAVAATKALVAPEGRRSLSEKWTPMACCQRSPKVSQDPLGLFASKKKEIQRKIFSTTRRRRPPCCVRGLDSGETSGCGRRSTGRARLSRCLGQFHAFCTALGDLFTCWSVTEPPVAGCVAGACYYTTLGARPPTSVTSINYNFIYCGERNGS